MRERGEGVREGGGKGERGLKDVSVVFCSCCL